MKFTLKLFKRISLEYKIAFLSIIRPFKHFIPENQFLIFSDPRGGSTWMAEMLLTIPDTALVWEPLNIRYVQKFRDLQFGWRQYIPEDISWPDATRVFKEVLSGKIISEWTVLNTEISRYLKAEHLIIKFCRGNMLLPWLVRQFNFSYLPVYLVRHPFAVVNSQLKQGGWDEPFNKFEVPSMRYNFVYKEHEDYLKSLESKEEILTAHWCITNGIPLNHQFNNIKWITIFYEHLIKDPENVLQHIFSRWNTEMPSIIHSKFRKQSLTTKGEINVKDIDRQLSKWKTELKKNQIEKMCSVMEYFNIKWYNATELMPLVEFN